MFNKRVKVSTIIKNQLPEFVRSEFPLVAEFLGQYYNSLESSGNPYDLMNNIDKYVSLKQSELKRDLALNSKV